MRSIVCSFAIVAAVVGCAQVYAPTSSNPALLRLPVSGSFGVGDQITLAAIDGISVQAAVQSGDYWRIDPGTRRLTLSYEASKKIVGARVAGSPLVLDTKLDAGRKYQVIFESSNVGVKAFVLRESDKRVVSNVAETQLMPAPATYPSPPPFFQIPAVRRR